MKRIKKNDTVSLDITDITDLGFGVGRADGAVVFVADTVPGDRVKAKIIKVNSSYLVGRVTEFEEKSPLRDSQRCEESLCRSCAYKLLPYTEEARLKESGVRRLFSAADMPPINCAPIITSPKTVRYRNKAQYPITLSRGEYRVGFFAPKSHRVTPVSDCPLTPRIFSEIAEELCAYFARHSLTVWDEETGGGLLRHVYLRRGEISGEILLTLVINGGSIPAVRELTDTLTARFPELVGILLNVNREKTNVILGDEFITLWGRDYIYDTLGGVKLRISAPAFYQVNHDCAELLYAKARELAAPTAFDVLLDLYCGAGSIGLSMAKDCREVIGIEIINAAVKCARKNAEENGITNAKFFTGDAVDTENLLAVAEAELGRKIHPDIIILDPPRGGCDVKLIDFVSRLAPKRIVYISCNPKTLARDTRHFATNGYFTDEVTPVDMFPGTGHVESVVCLSRAKAT